MIWLWFMIGMNWLVVGVDWLWLMIRVNRLWLVITTWLLPMSSVDWITFLLNLWVIETFCVLIDAWNWVWVPELWVSKMITDWFLISQGWRSVMMNIRKRGVVWLMSWVCLWLVVWVSVFRLWSFVNRLWGFVNWLWWIVWQWLWLVDGYRWIVWFWLWLVGDLKSIWVSRCLITIGTMTT